MINYIVLHFMKFKQTFYQDREMFYLLNIHIKQCLWPTRFQIFITQKNHYRTVQKSHFQPLLLFSRLLWTTEK